MRYHDFEGTIEELVNLKLKEIEEKENVTLLHAIESGSRAWGFASPDSDYDVRFIYVRNRDFYLRIDDTNDFIDWHLDEVLDINGWDVTKALRLFHKSNGTIFEWANSPIVYRTTELWNKIYTTSLSYFSRKACMYHYYGTAKGNYFEFLQEEYVKYKKYFYVIRPILACKWIEKYGSPAPVLFDVLKEKMLDEEMKGIINQLLEVKTKMNESEKGVRVDSVNNYIEKELAFYDESIKMMNNDTKKDWDDLNNVFVELLKSR